MLAWPPLHKRYKLTILLSQICSLSYYLQTGNNVNVFKLYFFRYGSKIDVKKSKSTWKPPGPWMWYLLSPGFWARHPAHQIVLSECPGVDKSFRHQISPRTGLMLIPREEYHSWPGQTGILVAFLPTHPLPLFPTHLFPRHLFGHTAINWQHQQALSKGTSPIARVRDQL